MGFEFLADPSCRLFIVAALLGILFDVISGLLQAIKNGELSSEKMRVGLWHKCGFICLIILGLYVQWVEGFADVDAYLGFDFPSAQAVCLYIIVTEIISIVENLKKLTPEIKIPQIENGGEK